MSDHRLRPQLYWWIAITIFGSANLLSSSLPGLGVRVVGGQCLWIKGLRSSAVSKAMFVSCFHPIAALLAAFLILRVAPTSAQMLGASVILVGIVLTQIGNSRNVKSMSTTIGTNDAEKIQELESGMGFKGI